MASHDPQAAATKEDIALLMEEFGKLYEATERWKNEMAGTMHNWKEEFHTEMQTWKDEIIHEFHIVAEDIRHDAMGAQKDSIVQLKEKTSDHDQRITRLEGKVGIAV